MPASQTSDPTLSVVLPFYNAEQTLHETLVSIRRQSLPGFELLAVDDGSTDSSAAIAAQHARQDSRIRLIHKERGGVVAATNHAIERSRSGLIARMDADDIMHERRLEKQVAFLARNPDIDMVGCQVKLFPEEAVQGGFIEYIRWQNRCLSVQDIVDEIYVELPLANPSIMFRRETIVGHGGYREGPFPEDYELQLRLVHAGCRLAKLPEVLLHWRESSGRLTRTDSRYSREAFDRLRAEFLARDSRVHSSRPLVVWGAGRKSRRRAGLLLEQGLVFDAWIDIDPRKIGNIVQGIPVVPPEWLEQSSRPFVLVYVNNHGARDLIAADLNAMGYRRGEDFLMVG